MKGTSKVMIGAALSMVMILAIVLGLVLAELYCSLLLPRRKLLKATKPSEEPPISQPQQNLGQSTPSPLSSFYCHGVLDAPRSFLFPKLPSRRENIEDQRHGKLHQFLRVGLASSSSSSPSPSYISVPQPHHHHHHHHDHGQDPEIQVEAEGTFDGTDSFMYISNPIYDDEVSGPTRVVERDTPFGTPGSSPSRLDGGSSGDEEIEEPEPEAAPSTSSPSSLPLTPMNQLPPNTSKAKSGSVALKDARSLGIVVSDSTSHFGKSSSSSDTPHTSPSW